MAVEKPSKTGYAMKSPTEKNKNTDPLIFHTLFNISNYKILSLTVLDRMQSVTHRRIHAQSGPNQYASSTSSKLGAKKNEKKNNKQCLSDTPRWSMTKTDIKNTKAIQNG